MAMIGALLALLLAQAIGNTSPPGVVVQDEGVDQGRARKLNFAGAGVSCAVTSGVGTCTISGGGGGASVTQITIDVGSAPLQSFTATITDASVTATSKVVAVQDGSAAGAPTIAFAGTPASATCAAGSSSCAVTTGFTVYGLVTVVAVLLEQDAAPTVRALTDSYGGAYYRRAATGGAATRAETWVNFGSTPAGTIRAVLDSAPTGPWNILVAQYTAVGAQGISAAVTGSAATASVSLTTQDANNFIVGGMVCNTTAAACTLTPTVGTSRAGGSQIQLMDNTVASPAAVSLSASLGIAGIEWSTAAVELRALAKTADENELDVLTCSASPATGSFILNCTALGTLLTGRYRINYLFQ